MNTVDEPIPIPGLLAPPVSAAATLWEEEPHLYMRLRTRLASYAPDTQRALASDWRSWRAWSARCERVPFPARPADIVDYLLAHSPPI